MKSCGESASRRSCRRPTPEGGEAATWQNDDGATESWPVVGFWDCILLLALRRVQCRL